MNTVIMEDESHSAEALKTMLTDYCPEVNITGMYHTVADGVRALQQNPVPLVFLDIMLKDGTGFDILRQLKHHNFHVVFTTAYDEFALKAIKFSALDYLLKPISLKELCESVQKAIRISSDSQLNRNINHLLLNMTGKEKLKQISLPTLSGYTFVEIGSIVRFEADGSYTKVFFTNGEEMTLSHHLKYFEDLLESENFFRVHHSDLINLNLIRKYVKGSGGYIVMRDGSKVDIAIRRKEDLLKALDIH